MKPKGICWAWDCTEKIKVQFKLKIDSDSGKTRYDGEIKACAKHFAAAFKEDFQGMITRIVEKEETA